MGRPRSTGNGDLPPNLYSHGTGFRYLNPKTGKPTTWAVPRERAIAAAKKCNAILMQGEPDLVAQVVGTDGKKVRDAVDLFRREELPHLGYSPKTLSEVELKLAKLENVAGHRGIAEYDVREAAELLRAITKSPRNRQQYRTLVVAVWAGAREELFST